MFYILDLFKGKRVLIDERNAYKSQLKTCKTEKGQIKDELAIALNDINTISDEVNVLNNIINQYKNTDVGQLVYPYPTPIAATKDYTWVFNCLSNYRVKFGFLPMDKSFNIASKEDIIKFLQWDLTNEPPYLGDNDQGSKIRDCDKYARRLWDRYSWMTPWNNIGFVLDLSGGHAYNCALCEDGRVYMLEPQSDKLWEFNSDKAKGIYDAESGYLLI